MTGSDAKGRGRLHGRGPGFFLALFPLVLAMGGCRQDGTPSRDVVLLETGEVQLPQGSRRHDVRLHGVGAEGEMTPATVEARVGDAVAFNAGDAITHSVVFLADRLDSAQVAFLESDGQLRGPPLLSEDASWIVTFEDAPPGDYPFACALHGGTGTIRLAPAE